jgi:hypothetical protein
MDEDRASSQSLRFENSVINTLPLTPTNLEIHCEITQASLPKVLSAMRTSSSDRRAPESSSSLDESHYEILSGSGILSDDEGNTVSVASQSVDGDTPDEFSSVNDTDEWTREGMVGDDEEDDQDSHEEQTTDVLQIDTPSGTENDEIDESGLTTRPGREILTLDFTQRPIPGTEVEELRSVLPYIPADTLETFRSGAFELENPIKVTIEMKASSKPTRLPMPFRILFVGDLHSEACDLILEHIGQALQEPNSGPNVTGPIKVTSSPSSQTSHSFYGLIPSSGVEMHIDHCVHAHRLGELELHDGSRLRIQDGKFYRTTSESQELCEPPHLVLYLHSELKRWTADLMLFDMVYNTLASCNVAVLEVAKSAIHHIINPLPLSTKSLKLVVNDADENNADVRLPVDLDLFCSIPPPVLNRHIGYLLQEVKSQESRHAVQHDYWRFAISAIRDFWDSTQKVLQPRVYCFWTVPPKLQLIALLFILLTILSSMLVPQYLRQRGPHSLVPHIPAPMLVERSSSTQSVPSTTSTVRLAPTPEFGRTLTPLSVGNPPNHNSRLPTRFSDLTMKALGRPQTPIDAKTREVSEKFTADIVGTNVFGIWPPSAFIKSNKLPEISIKVRCGSEQLSHRVTVVPNTGYIVELEPTDAHGLLSILIATTGKPKIVQNLSVDFGNSWLKVPGWRKAYSSIKSLVDISQPRKEPPGDDHRDIAKPLVDQFSEEVQKLAKLYHQSKTAAIKDVKSSTKSIIKQANKDMKQLKNAIRREMKAQQKMTKKLVAQSNEFARSMAERAVLVQHEIAETLEVSVKTLAHVMHNRVTEFVGPVRKARTIKKASGNAKGVWQKMKGNLKKEKKNAEEWAKKAKMTTKADLKEQTKDDTGLFFFTGIRGHRCNMKYEAKGDKHHFRCTDKGDCGRTKEKIRKEGCVRR